MDLDIIAHNLRVVRNLLAQERPAPLLACVLKADAYGLGALPVAEILVREGVDMLAVACLPEALELRGRFPDAKVFVMGHTPDEDIALAVRERIVCTVFDLHQAELFSLAAKRAGCAAVVHVKIDTGMNRLGIKPDASTTELLTRIASLPSVRTEGIFTHLALYDADSDRAQFSLFSRVLADAEKAGLRFAIRHACDSIGMMRYPEFRMDMVRAGAVLYGNVPMRTPFSETIDIRVPYALRTRISRLRRLAEGEGVGYDFTWRAPAGGALLATLPLGYADGFRRSMSNRAFVDIRGVRAPVVGLVCMDQCAVDASGVPGVSEGDDVLVLGEARDGSPPDGTATRRSVPVLEVADWGGTTRNEIICSIGRRVPRVYSRDGEGSAHGR